MPEIQFEVQWPDGTLETCYSPSLIVKKYFTPGEEYPLEEFVTRSRTALQAASERVRDKYGVPCGRALGQIQRIEATATRYAPLLQPKVRFRQFLAQDG